MVPIIGPLAMSYGMYVDGFRSSILPLLFMGRSSLSGMYHFFLYNNVRSVAWEVRTAETSCLGDMFIYQTPSL